MKIAVYTITKNEEQFVSRWAESCADADLRLIVDTGSSDGTIQEAQKAGCTTASISISPWRFDDARNASLALIPSDFDLCIALDADEVLTPGWREAIEKTPVGITRPRYKYVWSWNPDGSEGLTYWGDKIHARRNYRWTHPVHEVLRCTDEEKQWFCDGLEIHHHPDSSKSRSQYLPLLELAVKELPNDDRNQFYLGREYMYAGVLDKAKTHLLKALELSSWKPERSTAMRYLGRVTGEREHWLLRACAEAPDRREPWVDLARFYYESKDWSSCLASCLRALRITVKPMEYLCEADAWGSLPDDLASIACWNMGLKERAISHSEKALKLNPLDARLKGNYELMLGLLRKTAIDIIIPTKSNIEGLQQTLKIIRASEAVGSVIVVADGQGAYDSALSVVTGPNETLLQIEEGTGIQAMWNLGMRSGSEHNHVMFLNDDVTLEQSTISTLCSQLNSDETIGLICPNYDGRAISGETQDASGTCRGRYDGTGGIAGFCMTLRSDLRSRWRFDERMKWWYGDDDLVRWVSEVTGKRTVISARATCSSNSSWTVTNDPPKNFAQLVEIDRKVFCSKWGEDA